MKVLIIIRGHEISGQRCTWEIGWSGRCRGNQCRWLQSIVTMVLTFINCHLHTNSCIIGCAFKVTHSCSRYIVRWALWFIFALLNFNRLLSLNRFNFCNLLLILLFRSLFFFLKKTNSFLCHLLWPQKIILFVYAMKSLARYRRRPLLLALIA